MTSDKTALEQYVSDWFEDMTEDYDTEAAVLSDLLQGGCQSGIVGRLIYYSDTVQFYQTHKAEINELLYNTMREIGVTSPAELFGTWWFEDDPLALERYNQNLLAWFAFEETARRLYEDN